MVGRRRGRRPNIKTTLGQCLVFAGKCQCIYSVLTFLPKTRDIDPMLF